MQLLHGYVLSPLRQSKTTCVVIYLQTYIDVKYSIQAGWGVEGGREEGRKVGMQESKPCLVGEAC